MTIKRALVILKSFNSESKKKKMIKKTIIILLNLTIISFSQVNYEPTSNSVYSFLERISQKGIIQLNEEIKPFSRIYIARKIQNIEFRIKNSEEKDKNIKSKISKIERKELEFYIREFAEELKKLGIDVNEIENKKKLIDLGSDRFGFDQYNRFRLFSYQDENFGVFVDPIIKYELNNYDDGSSWSYSNGIKLYGNIGNNVGFDLQFYDNHPRGDNLDRNRFFSPKTGYEFSAGGKGDGFDFDRLNANLNFSWKYVTLTIGKDFNYYGNGYDGNLILSNKAPSFPYLKLEVYPTNWLRFSYINGLLHSQVLDSTTFRFNPQRNHISTVEKYFVAHMLSITPWQFLNISVGESVIYSDRFEPIYLVPFTFFRFADHYLTDPDENAGNAQIFGSLWYKNNYLKTKFYTSIFIDELTTRRSDYPQAVAYNVGFKIIDPIIPESELSFEYTRINPFVYSHVDSAQTYASYGYELGHWIGSNADEIFVKFTKRIVRGLNLDISYRYIRKGNEEDIAEERYREDQTFLWGDVNTIRWVDSQIQYEIMHNFKVRFNYQYIANNNSKRYILNTGSFLYFSVGYGI